VRYQAALRPDWADYTSGYAASRSRLVPARLSIERQRDFLDGLYNEFFMNDLVYAVIAYVRSPVGIFVEELRRELHPAHTHADAHLTILPPRPLRGSEQQALELVAEVSQSGTPFQVTMGEVETFIPVTPTVFLRVARGAYRMRELRDQLNRDALRFDEPWPYMPHLTIAKMDMASEAEKLLEVARQRWQAYTGPRTISIESLTLVKGSGERWVDIRKMRLGGRSGELAAT
jgi:2'-5' RNA ligase